MFSFTGIPRPALTLCHSWYMSDAWSQNIVSGRRFWNLASDAWFWNIAPDVWFQNIVPDTHQAPARRLPDASQTQLFKIRCQAEDFVMLHLTPDFETLQAQDFKTLHLMPARRQPDAIFRNQVSDARFQNHASDVIFCDHASDVQYKSSYVVVSWSGAQFRVDNMLSWWQKSEIFPEPICPDSDWIHVFFIFQKVLQNPMFTLPQNILEVCDLTDQ